MSNDTRVAILVFMIIAADVVITWRIGVAAWRDGYASALTRVRDDARWCRKVAGATADPEQIVERLQGEP